VLDDPDRSGITLASQQVLTKVLTPKVPTGNPIQVYFVELLAGAGGTLIDPQRLLAVHPAGRGQLDQDAGPAAGTLSQYANLQALQTLPQSSISATPRRQPVRAGRHGPGHHVTITKHLLIDGRLLLRADVRAVQPAARSYPATTSCSPRSGRQRLTAVSGRVADADRSLELG